MQTAVGWILPCSGPACNGRSASVVTARRGCKQGSNVFAGKHGFITPRDLFRWAGRGAVGYQQVATFMHMHAGAFADCIQSLGKVHWSPLHTAHHCWLYCQLQAGRCSAPL